MAVFKEKKFALKFKNEPIGNRYSKNHMFVGIDRTKVSELKPGNMGKGVIRTTIDNAYNFGSLDRAFDFMDHTASKLVLVEITMKYEMKELS